MSDIQRQKDMYRQGLDNAQCAECARLIVENAALNQGQKRWEGMYYEQLEENESLNTQNAALKVIVDRLSAPVSDEEETMWAKGLSEDMLHWVFSRENVSSLIVARAKEPA